MQKPVKQTAASTEGIVELTDFLFTFGPSHPGPLKGIYQK